MATKIKRAILYIALIILGLMCLLPFWLMMVNSTRSGVEITHSFDQRRSIDFKRDALVQDKAEDRVDPI